MKNSREVFYPNLEAEIARSGIPKKEIEKKLGLAHITFTRRLNGESDFSVNDVPALCSMFNMPVQELFSTSSKNADSEN